MFLIFHHRYQLITEMQTHLKNILKGLSKWKNVSTETQGPTEVELTTETQQGLSTIEKPDLGPKGGKPSSPDHLLESSTRERMTNFYYIGLIY